MTRRTQRQLCIITLAVILLAVILIASPTRSRAADIIKADNTTALDNAGSWVGGVMPGSGDIAVFDSTYNARFYPANLIFANAAGTVNWGGIRIANVSGAQNYNPIDLDLTNDTFGVLMRQGNSAKNLTLGAGGIDMSAATQALYVQNVTSLTASQTWSVANVNTGVGVLSKASGEDLLIGAATNKTLNLNGNTLTTTGAGTIVFSDGYTISNGTLDIGNSRFVIGAGTVASAANRSNLTTTSLGISVQTDSTLVIQPNGTGSASRSTVRSNITLNNSTLLLSSAITGDNHRVVLNQATLGGTGTVVKVGPGSAMFSADGGALNVALQAGSLIDVRGGVLKNDFGNSAWGSNFAPIQLGGSSTFDVWDGEATFDAINGTGSLNKGWSGDHTITIGSASGNGAHYGAIYNNKNLGYGHSASGNLGITKMGVGTQILGGNFGGGESYAGPTTIQQGTLVIAGNQTINSSVNAQAGTTLGVTVPTAGTSLTLPALATSIATLDLLTGATGNPTAPVVVTTGNFDATGATIRVTGSALAAGSNIPLVQYGSLSQGFGQLSLQVPARTVANLVDNSGSSRVDLNIASTDQVKWAGGPNWSANTGGWVLKSDGVTAANYLEDGSPNTGTGVGGTDIANFEDSGIATPNVNISGTVSPFGTVVSNSSGTYTFSGSGNISGIGQLVKNGVGTLVVANTGSNDYSGGTVISAGTLRVGNGTTAGAGTLGYGAIDNSATLVLDRPDNFTLSQVVTGSGSLVKDNTNTVTLKNVANFQGAVTINAGRLLLPDANTGSNNYVVNGTSTLELATESQSIVQLKNGSISGTGNFVKSGPGMVILGADTQPQQIALTGAASVIEVQGGVLRNEYGNPGWANNKAALVVGHAGVFEIWDGNTIVDYLSGSGRINQAWDSNHSLTFGINNGSGTFSGTVTNITLGYGESTGGRALTLIKEGTGTQTFTGRLFHAGGITVNNGTVVVAPTGATDSVNYAGNNTIAAGATLKFEFNTGYQRIRNGTLSGDGQFIKAGLGTLQLGDNGQPMNVALGAGVVIDVQAGAVKNDWGNGNGSPGWSGNLADLNVATGAYFDIWDGSATVDAVSGAGTIQVGINSSSTLQVGVNNGSGVFAGTLQNPAAGGTFPGGDTYSGGGTLNLVKQGSGTQTLSGTNTYTGTTTVSAGALLVNGTHTGGSAYTVQNTGTLGGTGSLTASVTVDNGGTLNPGASVGTLTTGDVALNGILKIEYSGSTIDKLIAGALDITNATVDFDNLGTTLTGSPRVFATYTSLIGAAFATVIDVPAGYTINYNYLSGNQIALVASAHPGDFDSDGDVDGADFVAWQTNFPTATGATLAQGDADADGDVDGADFVVWQTNFPFTPSPGIAPVPEPQSWMLLAIGSIAAARAYIRPRRRGTRS